jgi:hypothetical protein
MTPEVQRLMEDRNQNGIPDVIERMAQGGAGAAPFPLAAAGFRDAPRVDLGSVPPAPRQPSQRARDLVYAYTGAQGVIRLLGGIFLAVGLLVSSIFCWALPIDIALAFTGEPSTGTVLRTEIQTSVEVNGAHPILIHYRYRVGSETFEGSSPTLDAALLVRAQPGASVKLEVLPFAPSLSRIEGETYSPFGYFVVFVLLFPVIGGGLFISATRSNMREIRAFSRGNPKIARVTYMGPDTTTRVNGRNPFKIEWQHVENGATYKGSISHMEMSALADLPAAGEIVILVDPADPSSSTVWVP